MQRTEMKIALDSNFFSVGFDNYPGLELGGGVIQLSATALLLVFLVLRWPKNLRALTIARFSSILILLDSLLFVYSASILMLVVGVSSTYVVSQTLVLDRSFLLNLFNLDL